MAGNDEAVAAVIAFAAKEDDILAIPAFSMRTAGAMAYMPCIAIRSIFRI